VQKIHENVKECSQAGGMLKAGEKEGGQNFL
jgi:hypothetical protein